MKIYFVAFVIQTFFLVSAQAAAGTAGTVIATVKSDGGFTEAFVATGRDVQQAKQNLDRTAAFKQVALGEAIQCSTQSWWATVRGGNGGRYSLGAYCGSESRDGAIQRAIMRFQEEGGQLNDDAILDFGYSDGSNRSANLGASVVSPQINSGYGYCTVQGFYNRSETPMAWYNPSFNCGGPINLP